MPIPVISVAQMREWEKATWAAGVKVEAVMRKAGAAVARLAERLTRLDDSILILAGKGHNGDDAVFAAEFISGRRCKLVRVIDPEASSTDIVEHLRQEPSLIVDGLFGIGLNRPLSQAWMKLIEQINDTGIRILAVDVPSGLSADSGLPLDVAIRADHTITFGAVKQGMLKANAALFTGRIELAPDIGLEPCPFSTEVNWTVPEDFNRFPPRRPISGHKGTFGHLVIAAGSPGYHGAAVLAARGAQRAQPGLVTVFTHEAARVPVSAQLQSVMVHWGNEELSLPETCSAVLVGPGLASADVSEELKSATRRLWLESPLPVIVDASALDWLPEGDCPDGALRVITPHPGEAARLLKTSSAEIQNDRPKAVRELSRKWGGCHVVLKGHQTIIGRARAELSVNSSGNPYLAQGGSGDLLAGYLGGLLAQPQLQHQPDLTIRFAVWQHGAAADSLLTSRSNFNIEDLAVEIGLVRA